MKQLSYSNNFLQEIFLLVNEPECSDITITPSFKALKLTGFQNLNAIFSWVQI